MNLDAADVAIGLHPRGDRYDDVERVGRGGRVAPRAFPDLVLPVDEIFG
jgi:hypothetical protein